MKKWIKSHKIFIMYSVFGIGTSAINIGLYMFLSLVFGAELYQLWNVISWCVSVLYSFRVNKKYVFKSKTETSKESRKEFYGFVKGRVVALILDTVILSFAVSVLRFNDKIIKLASSLIVVSVNYYYTKKRVFKN